MNTEDVDLIAVT